MVYTSVGMGSQPTYEGLKPPLSAGALSSHRRSQPTYEGLKRRLKV